MIQKFTDRRDYRVQANFLAQLTMEDHRPEYGLVSDISLGGMKLLLHQRLAPETKLIIEFKQGATTVSLPAVCCWSRPIGITCHEFYTGVSFTKLEAENYQQLRTIIYQLAGR